MYKTINIPPFAGAEPTLEAIVKYSFDELEEVTIVINGTIELNADELLKDDWYNDYIAREIVKGEEL